MSRKLTDRQRRARQNRSKMRKIYVLKYWRSGGDFFSFSCLTPERLKQWGDDMRYAQK